MTFLDPAALVGLFELDEELLGLSKEIVDQLLHRNEAEIPVDSSAIARLYYRRDKTLSILFQDGSRYAIENFPALELHRWLNSGSIGGYWNANVRGRY